VGLGLRPGRAGGESSPVAPWDFRRKGKGRDCHLIPANTNFIDFCDRH